MKAITIASVLFLGSVSPAVGQDHAAHASQTTPAAQVFEHYEGVRRALSADKLSDVTSHAQQLAAGAGTVATAEAKKHADALAAATTLDDARKHFGELSTILVPIFQKANIPGATAFMCAMKKQPWMQKGDKIENPYYGKSMATCGSPLAPAGK